MTIQSNIKHSVIINSATPKARILDQFYTKREVARECYDFFMHSIYTSSGESDNSSPDCFIFIEPSAGNGAFYDLLPPAHRIGYDIEPAHAELKKLDFLSLSSTILQTDIDNLIQRVSNPNSMPHAAGNSAEPCLSEEEMSVEKFKIVFIGNPPFGKNASLAIKFLNHSAKFASYVGFILPKTFKKVGMYNRVDSHLTLIAEKELPSFSFVYEGMPYNVPCVFQVWQKKDIPRKKLINAVAHPHFHFTKREQGHFAVRRVGALAGKVIEDFKDYSPHSHYYIQVCPCEGEELATTIERIKNIFLQLNYEDVKYNTAGNPSVAKSEIIALYESHITYQEFAPGQMI